MRFSRAQLDEVSYLVNYKLLRNSCPWISLVIHTLVTNLGTFQEIFPCSSLIILDLYHLVLKKDRVLCNLLIRYTFVSKEIFFVTESQLLIYLVNNSALLCSALLRELRFGHTERAEKVTVRSTLNQCKYPIDYTLSSFTAVLIRLRLLDIMHS